MNTFEKYRTKKKKIRYIISKEKEIENELMEKYKKKRDETIEEWINKNMELIKQRNKEEIKYKKKNLNIKKKNGN